MTIDLQRLSGNMKFLRMKYGISQDELAHTIHLARSTYSAYETGVKIPDLQTIDALASLYNIGFDSLVNHDLACGLVNRIYFDQEDEELVSLLNDYMSLSIASRNLIAENLKMILEWELMFYQAYSKSKSTNEKADEDDGEMASQEQQHDELDGNGNRYDRRDGA